MGLQFTGLPLPAPASAGVTTLGRAKLVGKDRRYSSTVGNGQT